ncbi:MAG: hypothetical protein DCC67_17615 [Planctomycetota bacterium]|nr:MAG: hypothetical protein DCC67_17615 [Planctomycetota bacterium]
MRTPGRLARHACRAAIGCAALLAERPASAQQGYGAYYQQHAAKYGGHGPALNPTNYLYNQYFTSRPSVSPYLNLDRRAPAGATAYQAYIRPEQQRRQNVASQQAATIAARKQQGRVGGLPDRYKLGRAKQQPMPYYTQWYGSPVR